jgi:hypothetical protein
LAHHKIKVEAGQFGTIRALALIKLINKEQHHLYAAGEGVFTDGPFQFPQGLKRFNGFIKHNYQNDRNVVSTQFSLFKGSWNASGQIPNRAVDNGLICFFGAIDPTEGGQTSRYQASTKWNHYTKRGNSFEQQLYVGKYNFELYSNFTFFLHDPVNGDQIRQKENRFFTGYQSQFNQDFKLGNSIVQSMSGFQYRYDNINDIELARTISRSTVKEYLALGDGTQHNLGAFQKFKTDIDGWMVDLGLRADYIKFNYNDRSGKLSSGTSSGFVVSPKLKMQKSIEKTSNVYFNIGQGFHSNDMRVSVARTAKETMPTARGYDVGINYKLGRSFLQLGWWVLQSNQEFIYVGDEAIVEPSGRSLRKGIELSIRTEITKKFYTDHHIQYTVARGRDLPKNEAYIPLAPKWLAMGNFQYNGEKLQLQFKYRWMGDRPADELNDVVAKGYFITDLFIERKIRANHQIGLVIENLFNQRWKETQFLTESRLKDEREPVSEIHFTPGSPFFAKIQWTYLF